jgi:hypothetical protein
MGHSVDFCVIACFIQFLMESQPDSGLILIDARPAESARQFEEEISRPYVNEVEDDARNRRRPSRSSAQVHRLEPEVRNVPHSKFLSKRLMSNFALQFAIASKM